MKYNEFIKYKNDFFRPLTVEEDGKISSDKFLRFNIIKENILTDTIIESSVPAAIYSAITSILISKFPNKSEVETKLNSDNKNIEKQKLLECVEFPHKNMGIFIKQDDNNISYVEIIIDKDIYILKFDNTMNTNGKIINPFSNIIQVKPFNNMIVVWEKYDDSTIMCHILYNMWSTTCDKKELLNLLDNSVDEFLQNLRMLLYSNNECKGHILEYASLNTESSDVYDEAFGKELSYKRALLKKIKNDKKIFIGTIKKYVETYNSITKGVQRSKRLINKLSKRELQLNEYVTKLSNTNII